MAKYSRYRKINAVATPLLSWDIYSMHIYNMAKEAQIKLDIERLTAFGSTFSWDYNFEYLLEESYDALVLTDYNQTILWASKGFFKMTGYGVHYAKGKTPKFLQGENTSLETKDTLKKQIYKGKSFSGNLINYRKNGEQYVCGINIRPLVNQQKEITHFLALEREVF